MCNDTEGNDCGKRVIDGDEDEDEEEKGRIRKARSMSGQGEEVGINGKDSVDANYL